jgi:hypothetical protein
VVFCSAFQGRAIVSHGTRLPDRGTWRPGQDAGPVHSAVAPSCVPVRQTSHPPVVLQSLFCLRRSLGLKDGPGNAKPATISVWLRRRKVALTRHIQETRSTRAMRTWRSAVPLAPVTSGLSRPMADTASRRSGSMEASAGQIPKLTMRTRVHHQLRRRMDQGKWAPWISSSTRKVRPPKARTGALAAVSSR